MSVPTEPAPCSASIAPTGYVPHMRCASMRRHTDPEPTSAQQRHAHASVDSGPPRPPRRRRRRRRASPRARRPRGSLRALPPASRPPRARTRRRLSPRTPRPRVREPRETCESFRNSTSRPTGPTRRCPSPPRNLRARLGGFAAHAARGSRAPPSFGSDPFRSALDSNLFFSASSGLGSAWAWRCRRRAALWSSRPCLPARPRGCTAGGTNPSSRRSTSLSASASAR